MHSEWCVLPEATARAVMAAHSAGGRVIAIGTTAVRVLESAGEAARRPEPVDASPSDVSSPLADPSRVVPYAGWSQLFITPGFAFQHVDALVTNFHLPRSTLLMLVSAFAGVELIRDAYREAIEQHYRFYSFGDAMLIV
jgi:S-adenosylmethionine:tRNA ribosyltransferase-isomerase